MQLPERGVFIEFVSDGQVVGFPGLAFPKNERGEAPGRLTRRVEADSLGVARIDEETGREELVDGKEEGGLQGGGASGVLRRSPAICAMRLGGSNESLGCQSLRAADQGRSEPG